MENGFILYQVQIRMCLIGFRNYYGEMNMRIEHAAVYVQDLEKTREFFCRYFEATAGVQYHNRTTDFRSYFLSFTDGARLEIMTRPEVKTEQPNPYRTGYAHLAFSVGSASAVDELTERLKNDGYTVSSGPRTTGDGYYESCVVAVENLLVEITV